MWYISTVTWQFFLKLKMCLHSFLRFALCVWVRLSFCWKCCFQVRRDITCHIRSRRHTSRMEACDAVVGLWSELFTGSLCGLLAQGWVNASGESWDFAESSVPFLISVVVARVFMFTTGQLNICPPPSFLLQAKRSQTLVLSWVCVVPFQFHVSATVWKRDALNCPVKVLGKIYIIQAKIKHGCYATSPGFYPRSPISSHRITKMIYM